MKLRSPYRCDYCSTQEGKTVHWWLRQSNRESFTLLRWEGGLANINGYEHICSESCAAIALSKWMTSSASTRSGARGVNHSRVCR
jgi:hypothetical protein